MVSRVLSFISGRYDALFAAGIALGSGFELFKIHFEVAGVSFYKSFKNKQLAKELEAFEQTLQNHDKIISEYAGKNDA
ncbi:unnamed protein product, partial [Mesorhabditis spiculigera]